MRFTCLRTGRLLAFACFVALLTPETSAAGPGRPGRPVRPVRPPRPTRLPRQSPTATSVVAPSPTATPVAHGSACPIPPTNVFDTRLWHLFWKYPGVTKDLTGRVAFRIPRGSIGLQPEQETGSLALVTSTGESIIAMPELRFTRTSEGSWAASTEKGYVVLQTAPGAYTMSFNFQNVEELTLPPDFYTTGGKVCFSIGDSGVFERFVCQIKPGEGFLCHE